MIRFYMDEKFHGAIARELVRRGINCLTVQEDGREGLDDDSVMNRATLLDRVLVSCDRHMLTHAAIRLREGIDFSGLVYGHELRVSVGKAVLDLEFIAMACDFSELRNTVLRLPL